MPSIRQARVAEMIKRQLAEILQREMRDPRLSLVSITDVEVARDFTSAKVFISAIGEPEEKAGALKALQGAAGFLRGQLGRRLDLRTVPVLMFRYDTGIERGARMFELLRTEANAGPEGTAGEAAPGEDDDEEETTGEEEEADGDSRDAGADAGSGRRDP